MRKHQKRWIALAGGTAVCLAGFGLLGGASAAADDEGLRWPVIQQRASTYAIDGFEIGYLPPELERYGISAESATGKKGERASHIAWVQGPDSTYGKVAILRDADLTSLDVLRSRRYDHLEDASLERVEAESERQEAYVSESTGDYFFLQEEGVAVAAYLQPEKWDAEELAKFATSVRPQAAEVSEAASEPGEEAPQEEAPQEAPQEEAPEEDPAAEEEAEAQPGEEAPAEEPEPETPQDAGEPAAEEPAAEAPAEEAPGEQPAEDAEGEGAEAAGDGDGAAPETGGEAAEAGAEDADGSEAAADDAAEQDTEGAEGAAENADGSEEPAADEDAAAQEEGAEAATDGETVGIRLPQGATAVDVRTCLAEEVTGGELDGEMRETARNAEKFTEFWGETAIADRRTAVDACIQRLKADEWWYEEGAEKGDDATARYAGAWHQAPWTLPAQRMGD